MGRFYFHRNYSGRKKSIRPGGGWWYTDDIATYLKRFNIGSQVISLPNSDQLIKQCIDSNDLIILCLDMYYVQFNPLDFEHTNKFYVTPAAQWGHFLLIKGYKVVDNNMYLEAYDPYSDHNFYSAGTTLKGQDRYYLSAYIQPATTIWWPYAIVIPRRGKPSGVSKAYSIPKRAFIPVARG